MSTTEKMIQQVLDLREKGLAREEIAKELHLSEETVGWLLTRGSDSEKPPADVYIGWRSMGVLAKRLNDMSSIFADIVYEESEKRDFDVNTIMGIAINGIPIATAMAGEMDLEIAIFRPPKDDSDSAGGSILSNFASVRDKNIVIVDDVLSSGATMRNAIDYLRANQGNPVLCLAIVNKQRFDDIDGVPIRALIRTHVV